MWYLSVLLASLALAGAQDEASDATCETGQKKANPNDCGSYMECVFGKYMERPCPAGLNFDPEMSVCNWPAAVNCASSAGAGTATTTTSSGLTTSSATTRPITSSSSAMTEPTSSTSTVAPPGGATGKNVVCYHTNWSWYRPGKVLDPTALTVKVHDSWADVDNKMFERVVKQKSSGAKVMFAIGGWNDSAGSKYSKMVASKESRARFIESVVAFMDKWGFDGIDLDWEYPGCPQGACSATFAKDKDNLAMLVSEMRQQFGSKYLITAAVSAGKEKIDKGYDVPRLAKDLDFINVMTYDFGGAWDRKATHSSPFKTYPESEKPDFNMVSAMEYWMKAGAPAAKLVVGIPMYGRGVTLDNASNHALGSPGSKPAQQGEFTREAGYLSFYEVCQKVLKDGYQIVKDPNGNIGPYIHKDSQWISYDDWDIVFKKLEYAKSKDFGGAMIWSLALDDFSGQFCDCGKYPLLSLISATMKGQTPKKPDCRILQ